MSRWRQRTTSRLQVVGISRSTVLLGALVPTVLAAGLCHVLGAEIDRTIGIAGAVLAVATFGLSQWQSAGPRSRRVVMIPKSRSPFSSSVHRGLADMIGMYPEISLSTEWPPSPHADEVAWQAARLRSPDVLRADGVVIIPAADDDRIWSELARVSRAGAFVVVMDSKPRNAFFASRQAPRPCFVGSDFGVGGELVGSELLRWLSADVGRRAVVAMGPSWSFPGAERSRGIAHRLCVGEAASRAAFVQIDDWDKERVTALLRSAVMHMLDEHQHSPGFQLGVFCGNDKILFALERVLLRAVPAQLHDQICLIGYDGAVASDGQLMVSSCQMAIATVDTQPEEQGRAAAEVLIDEHRGLLSGRGSRYIEPSLIALGERDEPSLAES